MAVAVPFPRTSDEALKTLDLSPSPTPNPCGDQWIGDESETTIWRSLYGYKAVCRDAACLGNVVHVAEIEVARLASEDEVATRPDGTTRARCLLDEIDFHCEYQAHVDYAPVPSDRERQRVTLRQVSAIVDVPWTKWTVETFHYYCESCVTWF